MTSEVEEAAGICLRKGGLAVCRPFVPLSIRSTTVFAAQKFLQEKSCGSRIPAEILKAPVKGNEVSLQEN